MKNCARICSKLAQIENDVMPLPLERLTELAVELTNEEAATCRTIGFLFVAKYLTSDHPVIALSRIDHVASLQEIPSIACEALIKDLTDDNPDWQTMTLEQWKPLVDEWWNNHSEEYSRSD